VQTDKRVRHISEVVDGIASVKSYCWEQPFYDLINKFRSQEEIHIAHSQSLRSINLGLFYFVPPVACFATFVVYKATGGTLTLPLVYSTASLLLVLCTSIGRQWTRSIETGSEALSASERIENFLNVAGGVNSVTRRDEKRSISDDTSTLVKLGSASFSYDCVDDSEAVEKKVCALKSISLSVSAGELVMVIGEVGSGKSSLLAAILEEMTLIQADGSSPPAFQKKSGVRTAYCSQRPWIFAGTVKQNILLAGDPLSTDEAVEKYARAVRSCCLENDMERWPWYDETEIGKICFPSCLLIVLKQL